MITEATLSQIENDLHAGPTFVNAFRPFYCEEQAMFLLAVVKFKRNPTWDGVLSVYNKHIVTGSHLQANIPDPVRAGIENYVKSWGGAKKGLAAQGVNLHMGAVPSDLFNPAFATVMTMFDGQLNTNDACRAVCQKFLQDFNVTA
jgi:hypothetical protein